MKIVTSSNRTNERGRAKSEYYWTISVPKAAAKTGARFSKALKEMAAKETPTKKRTAVVEAKRPDGDLSLEIKECGDNGYVLYDRFLGKGNYAAVFLASPKPEQLAKNYRLRLLAEGKDRAPNVSEIFIRK